MCYKTKLNKISEVANLTETEKKQLEDFTDNCVGNAGEGYIPNEEYYKQHKEELKPIMRKLKDHEVFGTYLNLYRPLINQGILKVLNYEDEIF